MKTDASKPCKIRFCLQLIVCAFVLFSACVLANNSPTFQQLDTEEPSVQASGGGPKWKVTVAGIVGLLASGGIAGGLTGHFLSQRSSHKERELNNTQSWTLERGNITNYWDETAVFSVPYAEEGFESPRSSEGFSSLLKEYDENMETTPLFHQPMATTTSAEQLGIV